MPLDLWLVGLVLTFIVASALGMGLDAGITTARCRASLLLTSLQLRRRPLTAELCSELARVALIEIEPVREVIWPRKVTIAEEPGRLIIRVAGRDHAGVIATAIRHQIDVWRPKRLAVDVVFD